MEKTYRRRQHPSRDRIVNRSLPPAAGVRRGRDDKEGQADSGNGQVIRDRSLRERDPTPMRNCILSNPGQKFACCRVLVPGQAVAQRRDEFLFRPIFHLVAVEAGGQVLGHATLLQVDGHSGGHDGPPVVEAAIGLGLLLLSGFALHAQASPYSAPVARSTKRTASRINSFTLARPNFVLMRAQYACTVFKLKWRSPAICEVPRP